MAKCQHRKSVILVGNVFFDTNTLVYTNEYQIPDKMERCAIWLEELSALNKGVINLQVLNEFTNVSMRKKWFDNIDDLFLLIDDFSKLGSSPLTMSTFELAKSIVMSTNYGWWDCLLLASAKELNCAYFLSEDMNDSHNVNGVTIINPFLHLPSEII